MIYFDLAATSLQKPQCVIDAVCDAMKHAGNCGRGVYDSSLHAARIVYQAREKIAAFFGCPNASNVVFTSNSTEALNTAIFGLFQPGDHILSTDLEHNSVLRPLYALKSLGVETDFLPADSRGRIRYEDFEHYRKDNTKAIVCTHASNLTGTMLDLNQIGTFAREHHLLLIVDASQTAGVFPINMEEIQIDVLCFTGHKSLLGPQGTGGMCIREGISIRPLKCGGSGVHSFLPHQPEEMPTHLEAGTLNVHGIAGLSAAISYLNETGIDSIRQHEQMLMRRFYDGVRSIKGIQVYGDFYTENKPVEKAPIVALNWKDVPSGELADALAQEFGIAARAGAHCAPRMHTALGTASQGAVRFSFSHDNTVEEVDFAISALKSLCQE